MESYYYHALVIASVDQFDLVFSGCVILLVLMIGIGEIGDGDLALFLGGEAGAATC